MRKSAWHDLSTPALDIKKKKKKEEEEEKRYRMKWDCCWNECQNLCPKISYTAVVNKSTKELADC